MADSLSFGVYQKSHIIEVTRSHHIEFIFKHILVCEFSISSARRGLAYRSIDLKLFSPVHI